MSRTQDIIDKMQALMIADGNFGGVAEYSQSGWDADNFQYPLCLLLVEDDTITPLGLNKTEHELRLEIIFACNQFGEHGNRMTYHFADSLEDLLITNRSFTLTTGEVLDVRLTQKTYGLDFTDDGNVDGVNCQVIVKFMVSS